MMRGSNMRKKVHFRYWLSFIILIVLLLVFIFWNINSGSISISLNDIFQILFHKNGDETAYNIVWEIRLPRILAAVILGGFFLFQKRIRRKQTLLYDSLATVSFTFYYASLTGLTFTPGPIVDVRVTLFRY